MVIVLVTFPIIPTLISSLLVLIVMSFSKFAKNKNRFQLIATILILAVVLIASFTVNDTTQTPEQMVSMVIKANGLVEILRNAFPTLGMGLDGLVNANLGNQILNLFLLVATTVIVYLLYIELGQGLYLKGAVGSLASGKNNKKKLNEKKAFKNSSLAKTYIGKEFKTLFRNPIFFMQCILPAIIFPVLIVVMTFAGMKGEEGGSQVDITSLVTHKSSVVLGVAILCAIQFFLVFIYLSAPPISREGQNAVFMKYIPVPYMKQIDYKVFPSIVMTSFMGILTIVMVQVLFNLPIVYLLLITVCAIVMGVLQSYLSIIVDLKKPKLEWNSEYAVVKQNMNLIWPFVFSLLNITALVIFTALFGGMVNSYIFIALITVVYICLIFIVRNYIKNNTTKLLEKVY